MIVLLYSKVTQYHQWREPEMIWILDYDYNQTHHEYHTEWIDNPLFVSLQGWVPVHLASFI